MIALRPEPLAFYVVERTVDRGPRDIAIAGPFASSDEANAAKRLWRARGCAGAVVLYTRPSEIEIAPGGVQ